MAHPFALPTLRAELSQPIQLFARLFHVLLNSVRASAADGGRDLTLVCLSDTHCLTPARASIPAGDILIHAGDLTNAGTVAELQAQIDFLDGLPHRHKVAIAGNHDTYLDPASRATLAPAEQAAGPLDWKSIVYLQDSSAALPHHDDHQHHPPEAVVRVYGLPHIPACGGAEFAFQHARGVDVWGGVVPRDTAILVSHTPPQFHLDLPTALGDAALLAELARVRPRVHVFGHVHAARSDLVGRVCRGRTEVRWDAAQRWFEAAMRRLRTQTRAWPDLLLGLAALGMMVLCGAIAVVRERVLGAQPPRSTLLVNASLMYCDEGRLGNAPQVVYI